MPDLQAGRGRASPTSQKWPCEVDIVRAPEYCGPTVDTTEQFQALYSSIHACRKCPRVVPSPVCRQIIPVAARSRIVLMAQAPSEGGVRKSGVHWAGEHGQLRRPGGTFLERHSPRSAQAGPGSQADGSALHSFCRSVSPSSRSRHLHICKTDHPRSSCLSAPTDLASVAR